MKSSTDEALLVLARQKLEAALEKMRQFHIPPTPENIMVWYHYEHEDIPQLNVEVDKVIARTGSFSAQLNSQLYQRYFAEMDRKKLELLQDAMRQLITHFSDHLKVLNDDLGGYEDALTQCADSLQGDINSEELAKLIQMLLRETLEAKEVSTCARKKIDSLNQEVSQLRASLQELERSALEDALTGIANRRAFDQIFKDQLALTGNSPSGCCLLLIDIDNFKRFNDKYGHQSGDKVLRFVATMLKKMTKGQDFVSRYGGEEFALILPATGYSGGMSLAKTLVVNIAGSRLTIDAQKKLVDFVTVSVGVSWSRKGDTTESLFRRADASLYHAKETGRNRVIGQQDLERS